jgi:hypothetical protein
MTPLFSEKGDRFGRPAVSFYANERTGAHSRYPFSLLRLRDL